MSQPDKRATSPPPVFCVLHEGIVTFVSSSSVDVSGLAPESFKGRAAIEIVHPADRPRVSPYLEPGWSGTFKEQVRVQVTLAPRWTLETFYGDANVNGVDVFWRRSFGGRAAPAEASPPTND